MTGRVLRVASMAVVVVVAVTLQLTLFSHFSFDGVAPDLALLVVLGAALVRGPDYAAVVGFGAGLVLDLAPPADHVAGRWALALVIVGYVAGLMRQDTKPSAMTVVSTVAAASFVGSSVYALSGLVLGDAVAGGTDLVKVIVVALLWDVLLTPLVLPGVIRLLTRLEPARA
jgi:rod shape-determining protein MreD